MINRNTIKRIKKEMVLNDERFEALKHKFHKPSYQQDIQRDLDGNQVILNLDGQQLGSEVIRELSLG